MVVPPFRPPKAGEKTRGGYSGRARGERREGSTMLILT